MAAKTPITNIVLLPRSMRPRVAEDRDMIERYRLDMEAGNLFPPVTLYGGPAGDMAGSYLTPAGTIANLTKKDNVLVLVDGYHRLAATMALTGKHATTTMLSLIESGGWRKAQWAALTSDANHRHGLRLTNEDKNRIVNLLLDDEEWGTQSARWIAAHCHVSPGLVDTLKKKRRETATAAKTAKGRPTAYDRQSNSKVVDKRGRVMDTKNIGTTKKVSASTRERVALAKLRPTLDTITLPDVLQPSEAGAVGGRGNKAPNNIKSFTSKVDSIPSESDDTSQNWITYLSHVLDNARAALVGASWNRFVTEARERTAQLETDR